MVPNSNRFPASLEKGRKSPEEVHVLKNHRSRPIKLGQLCTLSFTHSVSRSVPLLHPQSYHSRPVAAMDDRSSAMPASFLDVPTDDALLVKGLPPLSPICVTISRQFILERAIEIIGGTIHRFTFTDTGSDELDVSVSIDLPPHSKSVVATCKQFHGPCIESTCVAALVYLQNTGIVNIDDANFTELKTCKRKLQAEKFWSSALYDRAEALRDQLSSLTAVNQGPQSKAKEQVAIYTPKHQNTTQTSQMVSSEDNTKGETASTPVTEKDNSVHHVAPKDKKKRKTARRVLFPEK